MMRAPAHLEATTPESRRLYERHGFEPQEVAGAYLQMQRQATRAPINCG